MQILTKYFYVNSMGRQQTKSVTTNDTWDKSTTDQKVIVESLKDKSAASSSSGVVVKAENPDWEQFQTKLGLLRAAATALQKCETGGDTLLCKFEVAGRTDAALKIKGNQLREMMGILRSFIQGVLVKLAEAEKIKMEDDGLSRFVGELGALVNTGHHHIGGYKEMYKRHQAMLG